MTPTQKRILIGACVVIGTLAIFSLYVPGLRPQPGSREVTTGTPAIGGAFSLTDAHGTRVTQDILNGHLTLLYFGFTHCPDVCPLALDTMTKALQVAGPLADTVIPMFISVDPERDTPQVVGDYVSNFHPRFVALTGTPAEIKAVTAAYKVYFAKTAGGKPEDYVMAHSDFIYLLGRDGRYLTHFRAEDTTVDIVSRLRRELDPP